MIKQPFTFLLPWVGAVVLAGGAGPVVAGSSPALPAVELNGVTSFLGVNRAFFVLNPDTSASRGFMLAEGQSQFGIKLLAVDRALNCVQIECCGQKQSLRICSTPTLTSSPDSGSAGHPANPIARDGNHFAGSTGSGSPVDQAAAGDPVPGAIAIAGGRSNPDQNPAPGQNSAAGLNGVDPAIALQDQSHTDWYQESARIERNRIETAQSVLAGEITPWPRTPLTPPGTPANLIGQEVFFANHMAGFLSSDYSRVN